MSSHLRKTKRNKVEQAKRERDILRLAASQVVFEIRGHHNEICIYVNLETSSGLYI